MSCTSKLKKEVVRCLQSFATYINAFYSSNTLFNNRNMLNCQISSIKYASDIRSNKGDWANEYFELFKNLFFDFFAPTLYPEATILDSSKKNVFHNKLLSVDSIKAFDFLFHL